jgi:hypothetical protein
MVARVASRADKNFGSGSGSDAEKSNDETPIAIRERSLVICGQQAASSGFVTRHPAYILE